MLRISSSQYAFKGVIARSSLTRSIPLTYKRSLTSQSQTTIKEEEPVTIYTGPLANVAKKLKLFSITSLGLGTGISPFVFAIDVPVPFVAKAALVGAGKFFFQLSKEKMFCIEKTNSIFFSCCDKCCFYWLNSMGHVPLCNKNHHPQSRQGKRIT